MQQHRAFDQLWVCGQCAKDRGPASVRGQAKITKRHVTGSRKRAG